MAERVFPACRRSRRSLFSFPSFFLSLSFLVFPFFCFPFYLPFVPLQVNGDTSVYRFPVRLVYWLFIAVQIYRRSFGTNRNAPGQPEDPIFLTMPVISAPSSRVQLVKTERQRERERVTRSTFRSKKDIAVSTTIVSPLPLLFSSSWNSRWTILRFLLSPLPLPLLLGTRGKIDLSRFALPESLNPFVGAIREKCWKGFAGIGKMKEKVCWSNGYWWHQS